MRVVVTGYSSAVLTTLLDDKAANRHNLCSLGRDTGIPFWSQCPATTFNLPHTLTGRRFIGESGLF